MADFDPFSGMTPEMIKEIFGLGPLAEQQGQLEGQLGQALALRNHQPQHHTTGYGAGLGSIGDLLKDVASYRQEGQIRPQMHDIATQQAAKRQALAEAWLQSMHGGGQQQPQQPAQPGPDDPGYYGAETGY